MPAKLGAAAKLYRLPTGPRLTWGTVGADGFTREGAAPATLDEVPNMRNVTFPLEDDKADVSTRGNNGFKANIPGLTDSTVTLEMVYDNTDADMLALLKAKMLKGTVALAILDGDKATVGTQGLWADFHVFKFEKQEPLEGGQMVAIEIGPAYSAVGPEWVKVTV